MWASLPRNCAALYEMQHIGKTLILRPRTDLLLPTSGARPDCSYHSYGFWLFVPRCGPLGLDRDCILSLRK